MKLRTSKTHVRRKPLYWILQQQIDILGRHHYIPIYKTRTKHPDSVLYFLRTFFDAHNIKKNSGKEEPISMAMKFGLGGIASFIDFENGTENFSMLPYHNFSMTAGTILPMKEIYVLSRWEGNYWRGDHRIETNKTPILFGYKYPIHCALRLRMLMTKRREKGVNRLFKYWERREAMIIKNLSNKYFSERSIDEINAIWDMLYYDLLKILFSDRHQKTSLSAFWEEFYPMLDKNSDGRNSLRRILSIHISKMIDAEIDKMKLHRNVGYEVRIFDVHSGMYV